MKLIKAIIRPDKLTDVLRSLYSADVRGLTVTNVRGHSGELEPVETYRGTTVKMDLREKIMLDNGVSEPFVEATVNAIREAACTGEVGDGKIFVIPIDRIVRVCTGEENRAAVPPVS